MLKPIHFRKKSGKMRTVYSPDDALKGALRLLVPLLEERARKVCPKLVVHGFAQGRSPVSNALMHIGYRYSLTFDLEDFFDTVKADMVRSHLTDEEIRSVFLDPGDGKGPRALQGLPTSPPVSNLAAAALDYALLDAIAESEYRVTYTRYADDLSFSFNVLEARGWLLRVVPAIVAQCGFRINPVKTRFMPASAGRRHITGIAVDATSIRPTRASKRRLRAARFQADHGQADPRRAEGLAEWCSLTPPLLWEQEESALARQATDILLGRTKP
jgi:hypothetical protein